jgi:hypothetical protein
MIQSGMTLLGLAMRGYRLRISFCLARPQGASAELLLCRARQGVLRNTTVRHWDERVPAPARCAVKAMYFTCQLATLEPAPPEMQQLFCAIHGNQKAMDDFARMNAGTMSPGELFTPENVNAIVLPLRTFRAGFRIVRSVGSFQMPPAPEASSTYWQRCKARRRPDADLTGRRSPFGELRDQAGTYVNLIASSPIGSLATRRSGGRGPAKKGVPRPSTTGWK